jgi:hypothetical protein
MLPQLLCHNCSVARRKCRYKARVHVWKVKHGVWALQASVNVVFSQSSFANPQSGVEKIIEENKKIYAKVATIHSLNDLDIGNIQFAEDGMGIDDTYFRLSVKSITGQDTEATLKVSVTNNWHDLSIVKVT